MNKKFLYGGLVACGLLVVAFVVRFAGGDKNDTSEATHLTQGRLGATEMVASADPQNTSSGQSGAIQEIPVETTCSREALAGMNLSEELKTLLGLTEKPASYKDRAKALRILYGNKSFSPDEVMALRSLLDFPLSAFPDMRPIEANALKNDALDLLLKQKTLPEGLGSQIVEMAANPDHDPVWQDYCIQFMEPFYERVTEVELATKNTKGHEGESALSADEVSAIHEAMFSALDRRDETLAGTSLIGLELLSRTHEEFDRDVITEKATEIAGDEMASAHCRLTAMRMASLLESEEVLPSARMLAQTGETVLLQCAAITTLGDFASPADRELLESLSQSSNQQISLAAQAAVEKLVN